MFRDIKDSEIFTRLADFFGKKSDFMWMQSINMMI